MGKLVTLDEVYNRFTPLRDMQKCIENARVFTTGAGTPFTNDELNQFEQMTMFYLVTEPDRSLFSISRKLKPYWPNRSTVAFNSQIYDFQVSHANEIYNMKVMYHQWDTLNGLNDILHDNSLLAPDEVIVNLNY